MVKSRIFKIFLIAVLFAGVFTVSGEDIALGSFCYLKNGFSNEKEGEFLFRALRVIHQMARKSKLKRPPRRTEIYLNAENWQFKSRRNKNMVRFPGNCAQWQESFAMRRILYGILWRIAFDLEQPENPAMLPLPVWLCAAMDEVLAGKLGAEQLSSLNKDYSAVRMIFKHCRKLPDFGTLCRFKAVPDDPAAATLYRQMSRLLMEVAAELKLLPGMLQDHAGMLPDDHWLSRFAAPQEAQVQLTDNARKFLWGRRASIPEPLMPEVLKNLQTIVIPELDASGTPSGKMLELSFAEANQLFLTGKRPDLEEVRTFYQNEWQAFSYLRSNKVRDLALQLRTIAGKIGSSKDTAEEFETVFKKLTKQLERENHQFRTFIKLSFVNLPVDQLYSWQFAAYKAGNRAAGIGRAGEFLEQTEKEYFENY